jgi:lipoprotein-anchoring transpeptidase ErfK/SrfK
MGMKALSAALLATALLLGATGCSRAVSNAANERTSPALASALPVSPSLKPTSPSPPPPSPSPPAPSLLGPGEHGVTTNAAKLQVWKKPTAPKPRESMKMKNPLGQQMTMLVADAEKSGSRTWYQIYLPDRPNGSEGWVKANDVEVVKLHDRIEIDLSKFRLDYFRDGKLADSFKVGIGRNIWPTPTGTFYVWATVPQASPLGPYGAYAMGLSGFSPVLSEWPGGGRVAIHGTANPADPGHKVSHGCIRVFNRDVVKLKHVPMGTPVLIQK